MKYVVLCTRECAAKAQWKVTVEKQINLLIHFIELFLRGKAKGWVYSETSDPCESSLFL